VLRNANNLKREEQREMFMELLPLLKQRVVMITVSDVGDGVLRVNVIPGNSTATPIRTRS